MQLGSQETIKTIATIASMARCGANIDVDAGDYVADVAVWQHADITIRAMVGPGYYHNNRKIDSPDNSGAIVAPSAADPH